MTTRRLAGGGAIPAIGQGATGMGSAERHDPARVEQRIAAMRHGIDRGLSYIDTAALYGGGFSEIVVGEALKGRRSKCFLASKLYPYDHYGEAEVRQSVAASLSRLQTDHLDLLQVHWPNPFMRRAEVMGALERLVEEGVVRFLGASNYCAQEIREAEDELTKVRFASCQYEFNLLNRAILADFSAKGLDTLLIAYSPLNQGHLTATDAQKAAVSQIAEARGLSPAQVIMAWVLSHPNVAAVAKASSIKHVDDLADALEVELSEQELEIIRATSHPGPSLVPTDEIELIGAGGRPAYATAEEALANALDLIPSPAALAERFRRGVLDMPVRLHAKPQGGYVIDAYDPIDHVKKYWGWVMAHGSNPIPAFVLD